MIRVVRHELGDHTTDIIEVFRQSTEPISIYDVCDILGCEIRYTQSLVAKMMKKDILEMTHKGDRVRPNLYTLGKRVTQGWDAVKLSRTISEPRV